MIDAKRQPLRAVEDEDELVAAGHVIQHVPLPPGPAPRRCQIQPPGRTRKEYCGDWWEATLDSARDAGALRPRAGVRRYDGRGATPASRTLFAACIGGGGRRPRVCTMRVSDEAETDLARASKTLDAAVALRELRLESDVVAPWREDISSIVALAARPLRGRCGAVLDLETWARFVRGPGAGSAGVVVDAAFGPEPEGPPHLSSSTGRARARRRGAAASRGCGPGSAGSRASFTTDEDADDAATAGPGGCARLRAAGPGAAETSRTSRPAPAAGGRPPTTPPAPRAAAERAASTHSYGSVWTKLAVADDAAAILF